MDPPRELSGEKAERRPEGLGSNEIPGKRSNLVLRFPRYFRSPVP